MDLKRILELKKCCEDFNYFSENYIKIHSPTKGVIPLKLFDFQKRLIETYNKEKFVILTKFRNGGFSTVSYIYALWQSIFNLDKNIMISEHSGNNAQELIEDVIYLLPEWIRPKIGRCNKNLIEFTENNCNLYFHNLNSCRGKRLDLLIIDEAAFHDEMDKKWKAVYTSLQDKCFILSTPNNLNWFYETYKNAKTGKNSFKVFHADYQEHPEHQNYLDLRENLGEKSFQQEILQNFILG
jgi:hypothetical protein